MQFLGLYLDKQSITLALVAKEKTNFEIKIVETFSVEQEGEEKAVEQHLQLLALKEKFFFTGTSLDTKRVLLRTLETPLKGKSALFKTLPFQLEHMIPYPLEELIVVPIIEKERSSKENPNSLVTLFCVQENMYREHIEKLKSYGIDPQWVGCVPQALYRFAKHYTEETEYILLHMTDRATHIIAVIEDRLCSAFQIEIGKEHFLEALAQEYSAADKKALRSLFDSITLSEMGDSYFANKMERFLQELDRVFYFLLHKKEGRRLEKIIFTKEETFLIRFKAYIERSLDFSLQVIQLKDPTFIKLKPYAIAIGSAIDVLSNDYKTLQFRPVCDAEKTLKKQVLKKIATYALTVTLCSVLIGGASHVFLRSKEKALGKQLTTILGKYAQELGEVAPNTHFFSALKRAEKSVSQIKKSYGYYVIPTKVTNFLNYIDETVQILNKNTLKLERFHYELEEYPTLNTPLQPYKIKVALTMAASDEEQLAEFFEILLKNHQWIVQNPPPSLIKESNRYEASFFITAS